MPKIRQFGFAGENRALHPKALPDSVGTLSLNQKPGRGDLRPWRHPLPVSTVPGGRKTIYRMGRDVENDSHYWLSWTSRVHAVRGFDVDDTTERTYFTGDGEPKVTDNIMGLASAPYPTSARPLGIPAPESALLATMDAGDWSGQDTSYYYTYTYVSDWGWESAPAPVSFEIVRPDDATVTLSGFSSAPAGNYGIDRIRIYRTQTGASGATEFFFLQEIAYSTSVAVDDNRDLGEVIPTATWLPAPKDLAHLTALWNGMLAGISGNAVRFCEPYVPYAWPTGYDIVPPDATPLAIGHFGQSILILTTGRPLIASGSSPDSMDQAPMDMPQGCVSVDSVVSMGSGVAWASNDGLCWYGVNGARIITAGIMTREDWQKINPASIVGQMYEGLYLGSYLDSEGVRRGFIVDPMAQGTGIFFLGTGYEAMHFDELQDQLYVLEGTNIKRWDAGQTFMGASFSSKIYQAPSPLNFSCGEVVADQYPLTLHVDAHGLSEEDATGVVEQSGGLMTRTGDGAVRYTCQVVGRGAFRLPAGFTAMDWKLTIETDGAVQEVSIATSMNELKQ